MNNEEQTRYMEWNDKLRSDLAEAKQVNLQLRYELSESKKLREQIALSLEGNQAEQMFPVAQIVRIAKV